MVSKETLMAWAPYANRDPRAGSVIKPKPGGVYFVGPKAGGNMFIVLRKDENGGIYDANETYYGNYPSVASFDREKLLGKTPREDSKTDNMVKLVQAGFDQEDVITMLREGLI